MNTPPNESPVDPAVPAPESAAAADVAEALIAQQKAAAPAAVMSAAPAASSGVLVVPRVFLNYVLIAIVFFGLGAVIAGAGVTALFNANSVENQKLVDAAAAAVAEAGGGAGAQQAGLQPGQRYDVSVDNDPTRGPADAPVTIVEFSDFRCPYCGRFVSDTLEPLLANYGDRVRMVYRDFPILGQSSLVAALAGQCMNDQGKFWDFHSLAFANQQNLTREAFVSYAEQLKLDVPTFTACLDNQVHLDEIRADATYAQNLGVTGTPAFFINGRFVSGAQPYEVFANLIDEELAKGPDGGADSSGNS